MFQLDPNILNNEKISHYPSNPNQQKLENFEKPFFLFENSTFVTVFDTIDNFNYISDKKILDAHDHSKLLKGFYQLFRNRIVEIDYTCISYKNQAFVLVCYSNYVTDNIWFVYLII